MSTKKSILLHVGYTKTVFDRTDLDNGQLAGTEYCAILLAEELAKLGHNVTIHGQVKNSTINSVDYRPIGTINNTFFDVVIGIAYAHVFKILDEYEIKFNKAYFWLHNEYAFNWYRGEHIGILDEELYKDPRLSGIVLVSQVHKTNFLSINSNLLTTSLIKRVSVIENGYDFYENKSSYSNKIKNRIIWSSAIDRGLLPILKNWNYLKQTIPDASLVICAPLYSKDFEFEYELFNQVDVNWLGNLSKDRLREEQQKAEWWLYPGDYFETFCLTHLEMINNRVKCLTSGAGNLKYLGAENRATVIEDGTPEDRVLEFIEIIKKSQVDKALEYKLINKTKIAYDWLPRFKWKIKAVEWLNLFE